MTKLTVGDVLASKEKTMPDKKVYWTSPVGEADDFGYPITDTIIDGRTRMGPWALMSPENHFYHGVGLGLGKGQKYKKQPDGKWLKIEG